MKILKYLNQKQRLGCLLTVFLAVAGSAVASIWPVKLSAIYEEIENGTIFNLRMAVSPLTVFGITYILAELFGLARRASTDVLAVSFEKSLRNMSFNKLLRLPTHFYEDNLSGEYTADVNQSVNGSCQLLKAICNNVVPSVLTGVFSTIQILKNAPIRVMPILVAYILLILVISRKQIRSQNGVRENLVHKKAALDGAICQSIQNIETIRVTNVEKYEFNRISPMTEDIRVCERKHHLCMSGYDGAKNIIKVMFTVFLLAFSVRMIAEGKMDKGGAITVILLFQQLIVPIDAIHIFLDEIASSTVKAKILVELLEAEEAGIFSESLKNADLENGDLVISDLSVYTPSSNQCIGSHISFEIKRSSMAAIVGPTGCGKSSVLKAIMRFYESDGLILLGHRELKTLSQEVLCKDIYSMPQTPMLITGTIKDNLCYGMETEPTPEQMRYALSCALIYDELSQKGDDVLNLSVSENGGNFSGGQKQRIALARAFLRKPKWFFLDEATAALDITTALKIMGNLKEYASKIDAGILLVSHQPEVVAICDEVRNLTNNATQKIA